MLYRFKIIHTLLLFTLLASSCKDQSSVNQNLNESEGKSNTVVYDPNVVEIPEDFPVFYNTFHIDPEYQLNHIVFPLEGKSETEKWTLEEWKIHKPFTENGEFRRDYENFAGIITETITDNKAMFYIIRRFSKVNDEWQLIYYTQGTNLDGFIEQ